MLLAESLRLRDRPRLRTITHPSSGAIPIPATLSLELGQVITEQQQDISYRFISDYPFKNRPPHEFDDFEREALADLRANPDLSATEATRTLLTDRIRLIVPIILGSRVSAVITLIRRVRNVTGGWVTSGVSKK
jgi:Protein of unknown function (DUF3365)